MNPLLRWLSELVLRILRTVDVPLLAALAALMTVSLVVQYSAGGDSMGFVLRQGARFAIGLVAMWALSRVTPQVLRAVSPYAYAA